jgi:hypothetical protein
MKSSILCDITLYSPLKVNRRFEGKCRLHRQGLRVNQVRNQHEAGSNQSRLLDSCLAYSATLKMETTCSSEISVDFQQTTRRHIPEDDPLQKFYCPARVYCPPATGPCAVPFTR